jgi:hypothetical protein
MRQDDAGKALAGLKATQRIAADIKEAILCFAEKGTPEIINSEAFDSVIRIHWRMREHVVPALMRQHPEKAELASEIQWLREQWYERNRIMVGKILERAKHYPGGRLAILSGAEHRYILRDLLSREKGIVLKEYGQLPEAGEATCPLP